MQNRFMVLVHIKISEKVFVLLIEQSQFVTENNQRETTKKMQARVMAFVYDSSFSSYRVNTICDEKNE